MMRCRDTRGLASAYIDGELDDVRASALRGHLRTCESCSAEVEDLAAIRDAAEALGAERIEPPPALWQNIQARVAEQEIADAQRSRVWLLWRRLRPHALTGAVVACAAAAALVWMLRSGDSGETVADGREAPATGGVPDSERAAADSERAMAPAMELHAARAAEIAEVDAMLAGAITDLRALAAEVRPTWKAEVRTAFDRRVAELDAEIERLRVAAAGTSGFAPGPRDELHAAQQALIDLLQKAVVGELVAEVSR